MKRKVMVSTSYRGGGRHDGHTNKYNGSEDENGGIEKEEDRD